MNTILLIALIVAIVVVVAMAVMLAFDRRQNRIVDAKLISEVEKNLALEERVKALTQEAHEAELRCRVLEVQNKNLQELAQPPVVYQCPRVVVFRESGVRSPE